MSQTTLTVKLKKLHPVQREIAEHPARFKVLCIGRRAGKTELCKDIIANAAIDNARPYAVFQPTYKMLRPFWDELKTMLYSITSRVNEQEKRLELITGAVIDCWSLDIPDGARGRKYAGVVIDEAAMIPKLQYAWEEVISPTLTDFQGWALFASTPKGRNFFHTLFMRGVGGNERWQSWQYPTTVNPHIQASEIALAQETLPERSFNQEYLAQFLDDAGAVFRGVNKVAINAIQDPEAHHSYVFGVDWGKSNDFTVITVFDETTRRMVNMVRFNQISWELQRGRLISLAQQYKPRLILAELNSIGEPNIEALEREGQPIKPFHTTNASKAQIIEALALNIEREEITLLNDPVLVGELQAYEMERLPSGSWRYSAPEGMHDDCVIATALGLEAMNTNNRPLSNVRRTPAPFGNDHDRDIDRFRRGM